MKLICIECAIAINPVFKSAPPDIFSSYVRSCYSPEKGNHYHRVECELCHMNHAVLEMNMGTKKGEYNPRTLEEVLTVIEMNQKAPDDVRDQSIHRLLKKI